MLSGIIYFFLEFEVVVIYVINEKVECIVDIDIKFEVGDMYVYCLVCNRLIWICVLIKIGRFVIIDVGGGIVDLVIYIIINFNFLKVKEVGFCDGDFVGFV